MKMWHLIFVTFFANYSLRKATECVDKGKLRPSFDEIFGKGWDEKGKRQQKMDKLPWENDGQMGEENGEKIGIDQIIDNNKQEKQNKISDQKKEDQLTDREKRVIIEKFHLIKKKLKEIGQFPNRKRTEIECQIGRQLLGVSRHKIYKWKREIRGNKKNNKHYYEEKKREFIERLDEFNKEMPRKGKQQKIAEELGIGERTLRKWKREMGLGKMEKFFSDWEKRAITEKFELIRNKLKEIGKFPYRKRGKIEWQIGKQLGVSRDRIYKWKKEFGTNKKGNYYYKQKKREFIGRLDEFKGMLREGKHKKIAEELGISERTLPKWKKELGVITSRRSFSDQQKREIIEKFDLIKRKLKEIIKFPRSQRVKIEQQIGKQLGANRDKIYKWKREVESCVEEEKDF